MVSADLARFIVGVIGNVISFGLFLSPVPTFYEIIKKKSVEEFKPDPYIATALNCMFWVFYGMPFVHPDSFLVITINSVGLLLEIIYLTIFFLYADYRGRTKVCISLLIELILVSIVIHITILALQGTKNRSLMVGIICDIFNILMYVSPLTIMKKVIKTRSVKYMPFPLSLASFFNGCIWMSYALIKFDIYILICNGIGVISGLLQLFIYAYYYLTGSKVEEIIEKEPSKLEQNKVQLSVIEGPCKV
ncbi:bidirectional sugar transporter SWEET5 [Cucumis sativus]|uniref:Bidirectional sugar transporter SWEET n=1 Tax=Cucumis sativus TaxID=3659 RepID=A0A0A0LG56_CUCSA|nr:bidirectional sugar transporter SWEET5 [Cucumis sativus]KGN59657.1 hypothetical protein Csa_002429 [Cucumis sativus]